MSNEDLNSRMKFIVEQQAILTANLEKLTEEVRATTAKVSITSARVDDLIERMDNFISMLMRSASINRMPTTTRTTETTND